MAESTPYRTPLTIPFGDVDSAGIVYYPRYAHYFHLAMERFFAEALQRRYPDCINEDHFGLPTVRLEVDYRRPLRYGDEAEIEVQLERAGGSSVIWRFRIIGAHGAVCTEARVVTVALDLDCFEKVSIPEWLRQRLEPHVVEEAVGGFRGVR